MVDKPKRSPVARVLEEAGEVTAKATVSGAYFHGDVAHDEAVAYVLVEHVLPKAKRGEAANSIWSGGGNARSARYRERDKWLREMADGKRGVSVAKIIQGRLMRLARKPTSDVEPDILERLNLCFHTKTGAVLGVDRIVRILSEK